MATGRSWDTVVADQARLRRGVRGLDILRPCVLGDGIAALDPADEALGRASAHRADAFVPASGAATRMFASWYRALELDDPSLAAAVERASSLAFWRGSVAETLAVWGSAPKGLLPMHPGGRRCVDEHLAEARQLGLSRCHFTVSAEHEGAFREALGSQATVSIQDPATDALAFDEDHNPCRDDDGALIFRPAGHGALLKNLSDFARDLVLIKNVDNVVTDEHRGPVLTWRWRLLGALVRLHERVLGVLASGSTAAAVALLREAFSLDVPPELALDALDRPLRVCGMVPDRGEPGGGPYWVRDADGLARPQIVEASELLPSASAHEAARRAATHFNPVEIAAATRGLRGRWPLEPYVDADAALIVCRSHRGRSLWSVERPGLWNGGMSRWNTVFVEVPEEIFQPVKTVADLERRAHR
jgi:hypothetical protein